MFSFSSFGTVLKRKYKGAIEVKTQELYKILEKSIQLSKNENMDAYKILMLLEKDLEPLLKEENDESELA
ncbi:hypothetical protein DFR59_11354 [Falsibacillus pallidus]|uniref:Uncharacterized protein n=1 Tax=Falsibacillus pallidus TaxID=493781 RepID=A0A370GA11_9BACI|nr:hypothetical protein DFR59_11354 [Falsibacillus pallidus]